MDSSVNISWNELSKKTKNKSMIKTKFNSNKSPFSTHKKFKKKKFRNKSKTVAKGFITKNNSFSKATPTFFGSMTKSSRFIPQRSKTPSLHRLKSPIGRQLYKGNKLHRISESKSGCEDDCLIVKPQTHREGFSGICGRDLGREKSQIEFDHDQK